MCSNKLLFKACLDDDVILVKQLLKQGVDINARNPHGNTPLHIACTNKHKEIVRLLLSDEKIDLNIKNNYGYSPLHDACHHFCPDIILMFLSDSRTNLFIKNNVGITPLATLIDDHVYTIDEYEMFMAIVRKFLVDQVDINDTYIKGDTLLHIASRKGLKDCVSLLLSFGADVNAVNYAHTPLYYACKFNHIDVTKLLIENGACVNKVANLSESPLQIACSEGHDDIVKILLKVPNLDTSYTSRQGYAAIHYFCIDGYDDILILLLEHGVDVNVTDGFKNTPLHIVCREDYLDLIEIMLKYGPDITIKNNDDKTPLDCCVSDEAIELIEQYEFELTKPVQE